MRDEELLTDIGLGLRVTETGCWEKESGRSSYGYGIVSYKGRQTLVHRLAWELCRGEIPEGMCVLHRCDNPPCCRPTHLFLGTRRDNNKDRLQKGRYAGMEKSWERRKENLKVFLKSCEERAKARV